MSEGIAVAIILSLPGTAAVVLQWWNGRKIKAVVNVVSAKVEGIAEKVEEVHQATNGMKAELVKVTGEKEFARGAQEEKDKQARI